MKADTFLKSSFIVSASSSISQLILIIFAPIITRLYDPEAFGFFSLYQSIIFFISLSSTLRISNAILTSDKDEINYLIGLSIRINFFLLLFVSVTCFLLSFFISSSLFLLVPFAFFLAINNTFFLNLVIYSKKFSQLAASRLLQSIFQVLVQCLIFSLGYFGLIYGHFLAQAVLFLMYLFFLKDIIFSKRTYPPKIFLRTFKKHFNFVRFGLFSLLINNLSRQFPIYALFIFFSAEVSGMYSLAYMVLAAPIGLLASNIYSVTISRIKEFRESFILDKFAKDITLLLIFISLPIFSTFLFFGESIFGIIFGKDWYMSGIFAQILSPMLFLVLVVTPLTSIFQLYDKLDIEFHFQILLIVSRLLSIFIGFYYESFYIAIILFSLSGFLLWTRHLRTILSLIGLNLGYLKKSLTYLFFTCLVGILLSLIESYNDSMQSTILCVFVFITSTYIYGMKNIKESYEKIQKNYT